MVNVTFHLGPPNSPVLILYTGEADLQVCSGAETLAGAGQNHHFDPWINVHQLVHPLQVFAHDVGKGIEFGRAVESD